MNRIALASETALAPITQSENDRLNDALTAPRSRFGRDFELPYATFAPIHYEEGYAYPLLVWLHDSASSEQELRQVMPLISMRNYVAIAPRGTCQDVNHRGCYGWQQSSDAIEAAQSHIADCISLAEQRFNIHAKRIFLVGRGAGGTMAVRTAWNNPEKFAGAITINGPLPSRFAPLRRVNELRRVPCLLTTSRDSESYPSDQVCQDLRLLHVAGCTVALRQYPGGDNLTSNMLSDLDRWVMELVCSGNATS
jgi:phospholipase/carboxylesterase